MEIVGWLAAGVLVLLAAAAAVATRLPALEGPVRHSVTAAEALLVVLVLADLVLVLQADSADRPDSLFTHLGYAAAAVGLLPLLVWRQPAEGEQDPEPASLWVVAVALLAVSVCVVRLVQTR